jgi:hypothetical protein
MGKFGYVNLYQVTFNLVVNGTIKQDTEPVDTRLVVAADLEQAFEVAREIQPELRRGAVHRETVVRDITLMQANVMIREYEQA